MAPLMGRWYTARMRSRTIPVAIAQGSADGSADVERIAMALARDGALTAVGGITAVWGYRYRCCAAG